MSQSREVAKQDIGHPPWRQNPHPPENWYEHDDTGRMAYPVPTDRLCPVHFVRRQGELLQEEG